MDATSNLLSSNLRHVLCMLHNIAGYPNVVLMFLLMHQVHNFMVPNHDFNLFYSHLFVDKGKINGNHSNLVRCSCAHSNCFLRVLSCSNADLFAAQSYDPQCGMSKEEFEWRHIRAEKIHQRMPQALHKLKVESEKVRLHFSDDPEALERWDEYMDDINYAFSRKLTYFLSSRTQVSPQHSFLFVSLKFHESGNNTTTVLLRGSPFLQPSHDLKSDPIFLSILDSYFNTFQ